MTQLVTLSEHHGWDPKRPNPMDWEKEYEPIPFPNKNDVDCVWEEKGKLRTHYYVGTGWLIPNEQAIYVKPKFHSEATDTDYLAMLTVALGQPEIGQHFESLFVMHADQPFITLDAKQDLLTPLLVMQFLKVMQKLVLRGLKKSYYPITQNLHSRIKGKVLVAQTLKQNTLKNKNLHTVCTYTEFGVNSVENRVLKHTLGFVQRYITQALPSGHEDSFHKPLHFIQPAFAEVGNEASLAEMKEGHINPFFKEYREALRLAKLILKRFAYNIRSVESAASVQVPPFWVDMSKLFELYVLASLRAVPGIGEVRYQHYATKANILDYLAVTKKWILDAKYKFAYEKGNFLVNDVRQLSGYARSRKLLRDLGYLQDEIQDALPPLPCIIIYPSMQEQDAALPDTANGFLLEKHQLNDYVQFFKVPLKLPLMGEVPTPATTD